MNFERNGDDQRTGKYCELLVLAAYTAEGKQTATPYGCQAGWDLLALEDGGWKRVQVKAARMTALGHAEVGFSRGAKKMRGGGYTDSDCDVIAAVYPETGTIWQVPIAVATGKTNMRLTSNFLWVSGSIAVADPMPLLTVVSGPAPARRVRDTRICKQRIALESLRMPERRPATISQDTWDMLLKFHAGRSYREIGLEYGIHHDTLRDRIAAAIERLRMLPSERLADARTPTDLRM